MTRRTYLLMLIYAVVAVGAALNVVYSHSSTARIVEAVILVGSLAMLYLTATGKVQ